MSKTAKREPRLHDAAMGRIAGWVQSQCAPWGDGPLGPQALREQLERLEPTSPSIFLFDFGAGSVSLRKKTSDEREPVASELELLRRAQLYLTLFRDVLAGFDLDCRFLLAIDVDDHPLATSGAPMFAFQKRVGSPLILLPDVDILSSDHFVSVEFDDPFTFEEKKDAAIFVGATTGADLTREVVENLSMPRLRSAVFFRDAPDVVFHLPKIVQYDTEETADMVRALGVSGSPASWSDQFGYKYLLSMDGNGATCSRVAVALRSHSVLIKYASDFQLFYFDGLTPGENLLAVSRDEDLQDVLEWCRSHLEEASAIAQAGRRFAQRHLSRLPVLTYVAHLLEAYGRTVLGQGLAHQTRLGQARPGQPGLVFGAMPEACAVLDGFAHVQNVGDLRPVLGGWLGSTDSGRALEGFVLEPGPGVDPLDIHCRAVLSDGSLSNPCSGFELCGTRGQNLSLQGVCISLKGSAAADYELSYRAVFADGSAVGPIPAGMVCRSRRRSPLSGLQLSVRPRRRRLRNG